MVLGALSRFFRGMPVKIKQFTQSPAAREVGRTAMQASYGRSIQAQNAHVTATLLQNLGPVITSLQSTKDAVLRAGTFLIVKVDWAVHVYQLTSAQQWTLDHQPQLLARPHEIIAALQLPGDESGNAIGD